MNSNSRPTLAVAACYGCLFSGLVLTAQTNSRQPAPPRIGYLNDGMNPAGAAISADQARLAEQQLTANPEDSDARAKLMKFYWFSGALQPRLDLIFWLIEHHPESDLHEMQTAGIFPDMNEGMRSSWYPGGNPLNNASDYARATDLWRVQMDQHPNDARVIFNAARALGFGKRPEIALIERAQQLDSGRFTTPLSLLYSQFLLGQRHDPELPLKIAATLAASTDLNLLSATAGEMLHRAIQTTVPGSGSQLQPGAIQELVGLIHHGQMLDPENPRWTDMLRSVPQLSQADGSPTLVQNKTVPVMNRLTVAGKNAAANLTYGPRPVYPMDAKAKNVQGTVRLTILVGTDGHVQDVKLESGPPELVAAAKSAVAQYLYRPMVANGQTWEVITDVEIPFQLPQ